MRAIRNFLKNESGAQAIEYGVALALLALLILGGLKFAGERLGLSLDAISNAIS